VDIKIKILNLPSKHKEEDDDDDDQQAIGDGQLT